MLMKLLLLLVMVMMVMMLMMLMMLMMVVMMMMMMTTSVSVSVCSLFPSFRRLVRRTSGHQLVPLGENSFGYRSCL